MAWGLPHCVIQRRNRRQGTSFFSEHHARGLPLITRRCGPCFYSSTVNPFPDKNAQEAISNGSSGAYGFALVIREAVRSITVKKHSLCLLVLAVEISH